MRRGLVAAWFEGEEASAALMPERLVYTLGVWVAAIIGEALPDAGGDLLQRHERASRAFARLARRIRDRGVWDDAFVDALCEPAPVVHARRSDLPRAGLRSGAARGAGGRAPRAGRVAAVVG